MSYEVTAGTVAPRSNPGVVGFVLLMSVIIGVSFIIPLVFAEGSGVLIRIFLAVSLLGGLGISIWTGNQMYAARQEKIRSLSHPTTPWVWRQRWQDGQIQSDADQQRLEAIGLCLIVCLLGGFLVFGMIMGLIESELTINQIVWNLGFQILMVALIWFMVRRTLLVMKRWACWSSWKLEMGDPGVHGQRLSATLTGELDAGAAEATLRARLRCLRHTQGRPSLVVSYTEGTPVWESPWTQFPVGEGSTEFSFDLPLEPPPSSWSNRRDRIEWRLTIEAYGGAVSYEVPVFRVHLEPDHAYQ